MSRHYSSFMIRRWLLADGAQRIVVEHVQSGEQLIVPTLDAATAWIGTFADGARQGTELPTATRPEDAAG